MTIFFWREKRGLCNAEGREECSLCSQRYEMREHWRGIADLDAKNNSISPKLLHLLLALLQSKIVMSSSFESGLDMYHP